MKINRLKYLQGCTDTFRLQCSSTHLDWHPNIKTILLLAKYAQKTNISLFLLISAAYLEDLYLCKFSSSSTHTLSLIFELDRLILDLPLPIALI